LQYVEARKQFNLCVDEAKRKYWERITKLASNPVNSKLIYAILRKQHGENQQASSLPSSPGQTVSMTLHERLQCVAHHIANTTFKPYPVAPSCAIFDAQIKAHVQSYVNQPQGAVSEHDLPFSMKELNAALDAFKGRRSKTAAGPDDVRACFLTSSCEPLKTALLSCYNFFLAKGVIPDQFRHSKAFLLFKGKGAPKESIDSYRTICVASIGLRVYETMLLARIMVAIPPGFWSRAQCGFTKNRSTLDCIGLLTQRVDRAYECFRRRRGGHGGSYLPVLFVDYQKAFDRCPHDYLIFKAAKAGVNGLLLQALIAYLSRRTFSLIFQGIACAPCEILAGTPQGGVLSPLIFSIFINDLPVCLPDDCVPCLFADDVCIYPAEGYDSEAACVLMMQVCSKLQQWALKWGMRMSETKTALVPFSKESLCGSAAVHLPTVNMGTAFTVRWAPSYCYLGMHMQYDLCWESHVQKVLKALHAGAFSIIRLFKGSSAPSFAAVRQLICTVLLPRVTYGLGIWRPTRGMCSRLQDILSLPLRVYLKLPSCTHRASILTLSNILQIESWYNVSLVCLGFTFAHKQGSPVTDVFRARYIRERELPAAQRGCMPFVQRVRAAELEFDRQLNCTVAAVPRSFDSGDELAAVAFSMRNVRQVLLRKAHVGDVSKWMAGSYGVLHKRSLHEPGCAGKIEPWFTFDNRLTASARARFILGHVSIGECLLHRHRVAVPSEANCSYCGCLDTRLHTVSICPRFAVPRAVYLGKLRSLNLALIPGLAALGGSGRSLIYDRSLLFQVTIGHLHDFSINGANKEQRLLLAKICKLSGRFLLRILDSYSS
jgi:hypothetical protein